MYSIKFVDCLWAAQISVTRHSRCASAARVEGGIAGTSAGIEDVMREDTLIAMKNKEDGTTELH